MWIHICFFCKRPLLSRVNKLNEPSIVMSIVQKNPQKRRVYVQTAQWKRLLLLSINKLNESANVLFFLQNNATQEGYAHENGPIKEMPAFECQQVGCPFDCLGVFTTEPYKRVLCIWKQPNKETYFGGAPTWTPLQLANFFCKRALRTRDVYVQTAMCIRKQPYLHETALCAQKKPFLHDKRPVPIQTAPCTWTQPCVYGNNLMHMKTALNAWKQPYVHEDSLIKETYYEVAASWTLL